MSDSAKFRVPFQAMFTYGFWSWWHVERMQQSNDE